MRKILVYAFVVSLLLVTSIQAGVNKDTSVVVDAGYSCYIVHNMRFVIPDYFNVSGLTDIEEGLSGIITDDPIGENVGIIMYWKDFGKKDKAMFTISPEEYTTTFAKEFLKDINSNAELGEVEALTSHGKDCYLITASVSDLSVPLICKILSIDDDETGIYFVLYSYPLELENTKYSNDFYKLLYTDPTVNIQSSSSKQDFVNAWDSYYKGLEDLGNGDYGGFVRGMADAMEYSGAFDESNSQNSQPNNASNNADEELDLDKYLRALEAIGNIAGALN